MSALFFCTKFLLCYFLGGSKNLEVHLCCTETTPLTKRSCDEYTLLPADEVPEIMLMHQFRSLLFFVLFTLFHTRLANNSGRRIHWIYIHYHKTGNEFTHKIAQAFASHCDSTWEVIRGIKHSDFKGHVKDIHTDIAIAPNPVQFPLNYPVDI